MSIKSSVEHARKPSARAGWYGVVLLAMVYVSASLNRQALVAIAEPIKAEMGLSDTQLGFLTSLSFAIAYALVGIPFGMLIDRISRRNLLAGVVALWSSCTAFCGLGANFVILSAMRFCVGMGVSANNSTAHSLISDLVTRESRSTALGLYGTGSAVGSFIAFSAGSWIAEEYGWRWTLFAASAPGLLLVLLLLTTMQEPLRGGQEVVAPHPRDAPPLGQVARFIWTQKSLVCLYLGFIGGAMAISGVTLWLTSFLVRVHEISLQQAGSYIGIVFALTAVVGGVGGGVVGDWLSARGTQRLPWLLSVEILLVAAAQIGMLLTQHLMVSLVLLAMAQILFFAHHPPIYSLIQSLVGVRMRGVAASSLILMSNVVGFGLGGQFVGILSDLLSPAMGQQSLRYALLVIVLMNFIAALFFILSGRTLIQDLQRAASENSSNP